MSKDAASAIVLEGIHCRIAILRPANGVVVVKLEGRDVGEFGSAPMQELSKDLDATDSIELFIDARAVEGASMDVSGEWALWLGKHRSHFKMINMLTGSPFIQLTANFVRRYAELGEIMRIYTREMAFDAELARSIKARS